MDLAHDRDRHALARRGERRALAGQAGADDEDVVFGHLRERSSSELWAPDSIGRTDASPARMPGSVTIAAQDAVGVHGDDRAEPAQPVGAQRGLERRRRIDPPRRRVDADLAGGQRRAALAQLVLDALREQQAAVAAVVVGDGQPRRLGRGWK